MKQVLKLFGGLGVLVLGGISVANYQHTLDDFRKTRGDIDEDESIGEAIAYNAVEGFLELSKLGIAFCAFMLAANVMKK